MSMDFDGARGSFPYGMDPIAGEANARSQRLEAELTELVREVDRLSMISQALWQILQEEHGYDDDVLRRKVLAIDVAERSDPNRGKAPAPPCAKCSRPMSRRHFRCIYCGAERATVDVFAR